MKTQRSSSVQKQANSAPFFAQQQKGKTSFFAPRIQTKLSIGQPGDKYEQEADAMADRISRMPKSNAPVGIQKKCTDCEEDIQRMSEEEEESIQMKCKDCEEKEKIRRMPTEEEDSPIQTKSQSNGMTASAGLSQQLYASKGGGSPLPASTNQFMSQAFNNDFSQVNIHTDAKAVQMNQQLNARAFTHGRDVFFNQGEYSPHTGEGQRLLAHELTHVVQQGAAQPRVQRKEAKNIDKVIRNLSYQFFLDWVITDGEVKEVLEILKPLSDQDLKDTVARLEKEGLVDRIFDEVSDDDKADFSNVLQRIHNLRVRKQKDGTSKVDSCTEGKRKQVTKAISGTVKWAKRSLSTLQSYVFDLEMNQTPNPTVDSLMDQHFFHQKTNGPLKNYQKLSYAREILNNFKATAEQKNPFTPFCSQPHDSSCPGTIAYVYRPNKSITFCPIFFNYSSASQLESAFHELVHVYAGVSDTGYQFNRIYPYLPPADSINNADSYTGFAVDLIKPKGLKNSSARTDKFDDCDQQKQALLQKRMAYAFVLIQNAENIITFPGSAHNKAGGTTDLFFKTSVRSKLSGVIEKFQELKKELAGKVTLECETNCKKGDKGYHNFLGSAVHICPDFFKISGEDEQTDELLLLLFDRYVSGHKGLHPSNAAFNRQTEKQARKNLWTFVAYTRATNNQSYPHMKASRRFRRDVTRKIIDTRDHLFSRMSIFFWDVNFARKFKTAFSVIENFLIKEWKTKNPNNTKDASALEQQYFKIIETFFALGEKAGSVLSDFSMATFIQTLHFKDSNKMYVKIIHDRMENQLLDSVFTVLQKQLTVIKANKPIDPSAAQQIQTKADKYLKNLPLLLTYKPVLDKLSRTYKKGEAVFSKIEKTLPNLSQLDFILETSGLSDVFRRSNPAIKKIIKNILEGKAYDPSMDFSSIDILYKNYIKRLREKKKNMSTRKRTEKRKRPAIRETL